MKGYKLLAYIIAVMLVFLNLCAFSKNVNAEKVDDSVLFTLHGDEDINLNDPFSLDLNISKATGVKSENITIEYDESMLQLTSFKLSEGERCTKSSNKNGVFNISLVSSNSNFINLDSKTLLRLNFKPKAKGETKVKITGGRVKRGTTSITNITSDECSDKTINVIDFNSDMLNKFKNGNASIEDFRNLGINNVTAESLPLINNELKGIENLTVQDIKNVVNRITKILETLGKINAGEGTLEDYELIGIQGVTDMNIREVNDSLKDKGYLKPEDVKNIVQVIEKVLYGDFKVILKEDDKTAIIESYIGDKSEVVIPLFITKNNVRYDVTEIEGFAFDECGFLTKVTMGYNVLSIDDCAFYGCTNLIEVTFGARLKTIGELAFSKCSSLKEINIPHSVESIGECAFAQCTSLKSVFMGKGVKSIGRMSFSDCSSLETFTLTNEIKEFGEDFLDSCSSITNIRLIKSTNTNCLKDSLLNMNDFYVVTISGENYSEVQLVRKGGKSLIFDNADYKLYNGNKLVEDFVISQDTALKCA